MGERDRSGWSESLIRRFRLERKASKAWPERERLETQITLTGALIEVAWAATAGQQHTG